MTNNEMKKNIKAIVNDINRAGSAYMAAASKVAALMADGVDVKDIRKALTDAGADKSAISYVVNIAVHWDVTSGMGYKVARAYVSAAKRDADGAKNAVAGEDYTGAKSDNERVNILSKVGKSDAVKPSTDRTTDAAAKRDALRAIVEKLRNKKNGDDVDAALRLISELAVMAGAMDTVKA